MDSFTSGCSSSSHQKQHLALRVALDTMKDRCILQQKRLSELEEENQQLRERSVQNIKPTGNGSHNAGGVAEIFQLRLQVSELQGQNVQLNAHINMVSAENRKLWQRLSQMTKEQSRAVEDKDTTLTNSNSGGIDSKESTRGATGSDGSANQNLIRSKTFTQHSPNPNLRHKLLPSDSCASKEMLHVSLETDVALEVFGDDSGKYHFGVDNDSSVSQVAMGFGYLTVDDSSANISVQNRDFNIEARKCMEGLQDMRREAMKQQQELNSVFALLESRIDLQPCPECVKKSHKPEMADKSLETDESFNDALKYNPTKNDLNINYADLSTDVLPLEKNNQLNFIQEKVLADETNNMCPMCGKIYGSQVTFLSFCEHVEEHFRDENIHDVDHIIENNFELISHSVGDF